MQKTRHLSRLVAPLLALLPFVSNGTAAAAVTGAEPIAIDLLPSAKRWTCEITSGTHRVYFGVHADKDTAERFARYYCELREPTYLCRPRHTSVSCIQK